MSDKWQVTIIHVEQGVNIYQGVCNMESSRRWYIDHHSEHYGLNFLDSKHTRIIIPDELLQKCFIRIEAIS